MEVNDHQAFIEVANISKVYGRRNNLTQVLQNISFTVDSGEFIGIMGPSGAGKTTLLNLLSTIDRPTSGSIIVNKKNISRLRGNKLSDFRRKEIGFVFQEFNLVDTLNGKDNILLPLAIDRYHLSEMEYRLDQVSEILGIRPFLNKFPAEMSVGQRQRIAAARAVITKPQVVFADEPTGALDSKAATELLQYFTLLNQQMKTSFIMVTHDAFTASYCTRILFIKDGVIFSEIVRHSSRKEFFQKIMEMQATVGGGTTPYAS